MCGRYTLRRISFVHKGLRGLGPMLPFEEFTERPRWNVAPSQVMPIAHLNEESRPGIYAARWGFIPAWAKEKPKVQPINARADSVAKSGMFRSAFQRRRCLVPADGFYEWQATGKAKQPYFFRRKDDELFAFAGMWDRWREPESKEAIETYTIITTSPNELTAPVHNRMPVILKEEDYSKWLSAAAKPEDLEALLAPYPAEEMEGYPVSTSVNSPKYDDAGCVEKVKGRWD
jgi:putative SOS response-associated peptidase YedK